jgi:hypothetical protein
MRIHAAPDLKHWSRLYCSSAQSLLSCFGYPVFSVLSWLSCHVFPVPAVFSLLSCYGHLVFAVIFWPSCPLCPGPLVLL